MAKQGGLGDNLYVDGVDLSGDTGLLGRISGGNSPLDSTGIDKSAIERLGGLRNGGIDWSSHFNKAVGQAHLTLSTRPETDRHIMYCRGTTLGNPAACMLGKQLNYDPSRGVDGGLAVALEAQSNGYGLEWGRLLTAGKRTDTVATNGSSVDLLAATPGAFGLQAYLQVFAFTGTSVTIKIQESSDNAVGDPFADVVGGTFTVVSSAPTFQRIATAAINVERYLRVVTTGTFNPVTFAVMAVRNDTAVVF